MADKQKVVLRILKNAGSAGITAAELHSRSHLSKSAIWNAVYRLRKTNNIVSKEGKYILEEKVSLHHKKSSLKTGSVQDSIISILTNSSEPISKKGLIEKSKVSEKSFHWTIHRLRKKGFKIENKNGMYQLKDLSFPFFSGGVILSEKPKAPKKISSNNTPNDIPWDKLALLSPAEIEDWLDMKRKEFCYKLCADAVIQAGEKVNSLRKELIHEE